jgi:hypothetical protein
MLLGILSTAEKIETIVQCRASGHLGTYAPLDDGRARVVADGLTVIVWHKPLPHDPLVSHWHAQFKMSVGVDAELIEAARLAIEMPAHHRQAQDFGAR